MAVNGLTDPIGEWGLLVKNVFWSTLSIMLAASSPGFAAEPHDWSGGYVGIGAGYGLTSATATDYFSYWCDADCADAVLDDGINSKGALAGGFAGLNFQSGQLVFGVEVDASTSWVDGKNTADDYSVDGYVYDTHLDWIGRARSRVGLATDSALPFIAIGVAVAKHNLDDTAVYDYEFSTADYGQDSKVHTGFSLGAGFDYALTQNIVIRAEYIYDFMGSQDYDIKLGEGDPDEDYISEVNLDMQTIRLGISLDF
jgi:outer membrane immunogenic protein